MSSIDLGVGGLSTSGVDSRFRFTDAKPKIYFKPASDALVEQRLTVFDQETSRDWDDSYADPSAYAEGEEPTKPGRSVPNFPLKN